MSRQSNKIVDSYIGMDDLVKIYSLVHAALLRMGFTEDKANRYAWYCQAIYKELKDRNDVLDGLKKIGSVYITQPLHS